MPRNLVLVVGHIKEVVPSIKINMDVMILIALEV